VAVCLTLPLFACAKKVSLPSKSLESPSAVESAALSPIMMKFDKNKDRIIDRTDWRRMKNDEKRTYARMSLEAIGENPDGIVEGKKTRENLLLEGLEAVYGK